MASLVRNDWGESEEWQYFSDSDFLTPEDKICEARFFLSQMQSEEDSDRFRWLTTAFVNAAYAFFEQVAMLAYYRSTHPDTGKPLPDREVLQRLDEYVVVFFENKYWGTLVLKQLVRSGARGGHSRRADQQARRLLADTTRRAEFQVNLSWNQRSAL